jgi:cytochrome c oxidase assembly protein subunit 15
MTNRTYDGPNYNRHLNQFARLTAAATFLLLIAGGLVTSNDAGLAVPDWPLSYGSLMPPMVGNIFYEHGHRMVATSVGLLTVVLVAWLWLREPRRWVRRVGLLALGAVIAQGVLGGITVLLLLPRPVSIAHASLAQIFFCLAVSLAVFTGPHWKTVEARREDTDRPSLSHLAALTTLAVFVQLILGAAYRHHAFGLLPHLTGAAVVTLLVIATVRRVRRSHPDSALQRPAMTLAALLAAQLLLGVSAYVSLVLASQASQPLPLMVTLTVAHLAVGALLLATSVVLLLHSHRLLVPRGQAPAFTSTGKEATA